MVGGPIEQAKLQFPGRRYHIHNAAMTAVRSGEDEYRRLADHLATLLQDSRGSVTMYVPLGGLSAHDSKEGYLYDPTLPPVLAAHLRRALPARVPLHELPHHINDPEFADALIARVLEITALP
ncbi:MAG TPA: Tm-1-like ATP-binding domain-containing protein, partial [Steroidobacteraceae bacterium]|nr:Tm-1-like ATP-binding domain-containing protein [Steroidobacteraceae bacterium]